MAIQTKLIIFNGFQSKEVELTEQTNWSEALFEFSEYGRCDVTLETAEPHTILELEYMNEEGIISLSPFETITLAHHELNEEGYVPGNFKAKLIQGELEKEGYFTVTPQSLDTQTLARMRELLEMKATGITRNLYGQKLVGQEQDNDFDCLNLLTYLTQSHEELRQALIQIERNPIESLEPYYVQSPIAKKQNAKSQRWQATKGIRHQQQSGQPIYLEPKMRLNVDTPENRCLKHILYDLLHKTTRLKEYDQQEYQLLSERHQSLLKDLERLTESKNKGAQHYQFKKHQGALSFEIQLKEQELEDYKERMESHLERFRPVRALNTQLQHLLNETWLAPITPMFKGVITQRLLKHRAYAYLYLVYQEMNKRMDEGQDQLTFPYHQTSKLFEYYNVLLWIELLEQQGFMWKSGWLKDLENQRSTTQAYSLQAEEELLFQHTSGARIRLSYDKFLNNASEAKRLNQEQLVSVNSSSRRPDILIELFQEQQFISAMIVEIKYRKLKSLYQELAETDVMKQLIDYRALNYYDPNRRPNMIRNAVDTIVVIYPEHEGAKYIHEESYDFQFIPVNPVSFSEDAAGISLVKQSLTDFLSRYVLE